MTETTFEPADAPVTPAPLAPESLESAASPESAALAAPPLGQPAAPPAPRRLLNRWVVLGGLITLSLLFLLGWGLVNTNRSRPEAGQTAPGFAMEFFDGYEWQDRSAATLDDMKGQVVVLNFWASWCVECRVEADLLENTWRTYRDQDVVFLGVAYVDVEPKSIDYMREFNITYPNAPDLESAISSEYRVTGVPETFFIDRDGTVRHVVVGPVNAAQLDAYLRELVGEEA